jgi:4-amino-4-deoxy-L-arabinose transferase-like glycosyltransferase
MNPRQFRQVPAADTGSRPPGDLLGWAHRQIRSPLFWILCGVAALRIAGLGWGLPGADGWDDDGIAPRDFLVGAAKTYQPGDYFVYPPLHLLLLTLLTSPGWIVGLVRARSLAPPDLVAELIHIPYMTFFAVVARIVSIAMALGTVVWVGKMGEELGGKRAGVCAAAACALNATFTYYGQVTNLDGPYLFWATLAAWRWMRAIARREPRRLRWAALPTVAAVVTMDEAYAVFLLSLPLVFATWFAADRWPRQHMKSVLVSLGVGIAVAAVVLLVVDGAVTNPLGFRARIAFLLGPASQDHLYYRADWVGRLHLLGDAWDYVPRYYPVSAVYLAIVGLALHVWRWRANPAVWVAGLFPIFAIVSFTVTFNLIVLRTENRFLLPQSIFLAVYVGLAVDAFAFAANPFVKWGARLALLPLAAAALFQCVAVEAALVGDPRYDAERWLRVHVRPGDTIETYGPNSHLPRFPGNALVTRVAPTPVTSRSPLPDVTEVMQPFETVEARKPRFIVISDFWVNWYLNPGEFGEDNGRINSKVRQAFLKEVDARLYFHNLVEGRLPYALAHASDYTSDFWPAIHVHQSTAETIWIYELTAARPATVAPR